MASDAKMQRPPRGDRKDVMRDRPFGDRGERLPGDGSGGHTFRKSAASGVTGASGSGGNATGATGGPPARHSFHTNNKR